MYECEEWDIPTYEPYEPETYEVVICVPTALLEVWSRPPSPTTPLPARRREERETEKIQRVSGGRSEGQTQQKSNMTLFLMAGILIFLALGLITTHSLSGLSSSSTHTPYAAPAVGSFGLDYVDGPSPATLRAEGVSFVCRYLSEDNEFTHGKILTRTEAQSLSASHVALISNYEWYATRALEGYDVGVQDAQIAAVQHAAAGGPQDRPIYFSVDTDTTGPQVAAYFQGVASVIGIQRTGAYGSYQVLKYLFDQGIIRWGWQTYAWSYGAWEPRAQIQQYQNSMVWSGHSVDYDRVTTHDFGQWLV